MSPKLGTLGLFGNLHIATSKILSPILRETRTEEDFMENIDGLVCTEAEGQWRFVTNKIAEQCRIETDLGAKVSHGILQSVQSRRDFMTDKSHRIRFIYTPKHCKWRNQTEIWFGRLRRKLTRHGSLSSLNDLGDRVVRFIDYYNETIARSYRGTRDGTLLCK